MVEPNDTVAATVLFTDLVGSTELASGLSTSDAEALRRTHFGLLRGAIDATGGREIKNLGDGLMVAFTSPSRAVECAVGMQQAIDRHNRRSTTRLQIRVGLSTGEVVQEDSDLFGDPVVEAARLCARATGGQILATSLVQLTLGRRTTQRFSSVGDLELKGLPEPVATVEVGWEPTPDDLADDAAGGGVPLPARLAAAATAGRLGFCGRSAELSRLAEAEKVASAEARLQVVLIAGEPGIGKTSVAAQAAGRSHGDGTTVLFGSCQEDVGSPYQPWTMALSHLVRHCSSEIVDGLSAVHAGALRRFLPGEAALLPAGESVTSDPDTERRLLMDAMSGLFDLASQATPVFFVVDDLHWADAASLAMLRHLITSSLSLRMVIVATYRDSDLSADHPLTALLADLHREPGVIRMQVGGLDDLDMVGLVEAAAGDRPDEQGVAFAQALRQETGGNPFFVGEILRHLGESGALISSDSGGFGVAGDLSELAFPPSVRDVVMRRVRRLGDDTLRVLSVAAVIGPDFSLGLLDAVAETGQDQLLDLLDSAAAAALVAEVREDPGRYRFTHGLIQHALYDELSAARRQRLHLKVAEALEAEVLARNDAGRSAELALHWSAATAPSNVGKAVEYCRKAGDEAKDALAMTDAARWYRRALEFAERDARVDREVHCRLLIALGAALAVSDPRAASATVKEAGLLAEQIDDPDLLVTWATTRLGGWRASEAADAEVLRLTRKALDSVAPDDVGLRARLLGVVTEETDPSAWRERQDLAAQALDAAEASGDDAVFLEVFIATAFVAGADQAEEKRRLSARAVEIAERGTDPILLASALNWYRDALLALGEVNQARAAAQRVDELSAAYPLPPVQLFAATGGAELNLLSGDLAAVEAQADILLSLGAESQQALATYGGALLASRWCQGRLAEHVALFADAAAELASYSGFRLALILAHLEADDVESAKALYDVDAGIDFEGYPHDQIWLSSLSLVAEVAVRLGDADGARVIYEKLSPYPDMHCCGGPIYYGVAGRSLGNAAALIGRSAEAERLLRHALDVHRDIDARYWTARTALDLGTLLLSGTPTSEATAEARLLLAEAEDLATAGGYQAVIRDVESLRR